jgi:hypothetical protein
MSQTAPRKSYFQIVALFGAFLALSGWSQELVIVETEIFEVTVTPEQAAEIDYDFEVTADKMDEKTEDLVEDLFGEGVDESAPAWLPRLVYAPYLVMGFIGLLSLLGFRCWGGLLGASCLILSTVVLAASTTAEVITPEVVDAIAQKTLPQDLELTTKAVTGPAILRLQLGSGLVMLASLVALIRPDRLDKN